MSNELRPGKVALAPTFRPILPSKPNMRLTERLDDVRSDVRLAVRQLIAAPGFTLVAALTLALGIGVNSAIFALADAALMRPLPFGQAERLVMLWERLPTSPKTGVSPLNMRDWSLQSRSFEGIAAVQRGMGGGPLLTAPDGSIETAERQSVTANFFDVLRVTPIVGRTFRPEDDGPSPRVVLLGEAVWRRRFSSDPVDRRPPRALERPALHGGRGRRRRRPVLASGRDLDALAAVPGRSPDARGTRVRSRRAPEARRDDGSRAGRAGRDRRPARARVSRSEQGQPASSSNRSAPASSAATCRRRRCSCWAWSVSCCSCAVRTSPTCCSRGRRRAPVRLPCAPRSAPSADASSGSCSRRAWCSRRWAGRWASASAPRSSGPRRR